MAKNPRLDEKGREIVDPTPVAVPVGFKRPESIQAMIARMIRSQEIMRELDSKGIETFEEAEDFDCPEDDSYTPNSPWEEQYYGQFDEEKALESRHFEGHGSERKRKNPKPKKEAKEENAAPSKDEGSARRQPEVDASK